MRPKSSIRLLFERLEPGASTVVIGDARIIRKVQWRLHRTTSLRFSVNTTPAGLRVTRLPAQRLFQCAALPQSLYLRKDGLLTELRFSDSSMTSDSSMPPSGSFFLSRADAKRLATALQEFAA